MDKCSERLGKARDILFEASMMVLEAQDLLKKVDAKSIDGLNSSDNYKIKKVIDGIDNGVFFSDLYHFGLVIASASPISQEDRSVGKFGLFDIETINDAVDVLEGKIGLEDISEKRRQKASLILSSFGERK